MFLVRVDAPTLRLTLFVAGDVRLKPRGEFGELFPARHGDLLYEIHLRRNPPAYTLRWLDTGH